MIGLVGCTGDSDSGSDSGDDDGTSYGTLSTAVTDQPSAIDDFESLTVTIDGIWITPAGSDEEDTDDSDEATNETDTNETDAEDAEDDEEMAEADDDDEDGGRRYIEFEEPQEADLVQLQGSSTKLIDETEVETGDYAFLQINVAGTEGCSDRRLRGRGHHSRERPAEVQHELRGSPRGDDPVYRRLRTEQTRPQRLHHPSGRHVNDGTLRRRRVRWWRRRHH